MTLSFKEGVKLLFFIVYYNSFTTYFLEFSVSYFFFRVIFLILFPGSPLTTIDRNFIDYPFLK